MKKSFAVQSSFEQGMADGIKQDEIYEANPTNITSVRWLENYTNTLQQGAAIKRYGEVDSGLDYLDLSYFTPNEPYDYIIGTNAFEAEKAAWLQGVQIYDTVKPQYITNYVCFLRRHPNLTAVYSEEYIPQYVKDEAATTGFIEAEAVAVVNYTKSSKDEPTRWQEVWADGVSSFPGWYTFGTLADVTRYGETLLFTTILENGTYYIYDSGLAKYVPSPVNSYLFPVYRYLYWDIRKKQEAGNQFLRGLADYADLSSVDYAKWKVLPPAQSLTNLEVGMVTGVQDTLSHTNVDGSNDAYDINLIIEECVYVGARYQFSVSYSLTDTYYPQWINKEYFTANTTYALTEYKLLIPNERVISVEELDLPKFNEKAFGKFEEHFTLIHFPKTYPLGTDSIRAKRKSSVPIFVSGIQRNSINLLSGITTTYSDRVHSSAPSMEKYTEAQAPRLFLYGEEIEFIVTINVSGIEVLLYRGTYVVKKEPYTAPAYAAPPYDSQIFPFKSPTLGNVNAGNIGYGLYDTDITCFNEVTGVQNSLYIGVTYQVNTNVYPQSGANYNQYYESLLYTSIEVGVEAMEKLIDSNCSSISVWAIKPDTERHIFKSVGTTVDSPSGNIYNKPQIQSNEVVDYTKYALLKKYVIDGQTEPPNSYSNWNRNPLATNAWYKRHDQGLTGIRDARDFYTAIPLKSKEDGGDIMPSLPFFPNQANVDLYLDGTNPTMFDTSWWTPDFVIWDYPTETTLYLNSSGKYWKGLGARLITVIKGRTFIGGCIGADGVEEQAIIRYSDVQGGAISPDIFSDERKIQVGHKPHTALLEFREQLWAFSRYQFYRIGFAAITEESTWEFFDVVEQGTFNNKSFVVVPYGVCFCNEGGVWLSQGGDPQNIGVSVLPTYQSISTNQVYAYTASNAMPGIPYINEQDINPYLEVSYNSFEDELVIYTPLFAIESYPIDGGATDDYKPVSDFSLIFSFKKKSWRIETSQVPTYNIDIA